MTAKKQKPNPPPRFVESKQNRYRVLDWVQFLFLTPVLNLEKATQALADLPNARGIEIVPVKAEGKSIDMPSEDFSEHFNYAFYGHTWDPPAQEKALPESDSVAE